MFVHFFDINISYYKSSVKKDEQIGGLSMIGSNEERKNITPESSQGNIPPDGSYRYVRPESKEVLYRDASVEATQDTIKMPRCYEPPKTQTRGEPKKAEKDLAPGKGFFWKAACMCLICALLGGVAGGGITATVIHKNAEAAAMEQQQFTEDPDQEPPVSTDVTQPYPNLPTNVSMEPTGMEPADIYNQACEEVVGITTEVITRNFWGQVSSTPVSGTGFIISEDGYIMTNYHVIEEAHLNGYDITVMMYDGTTYQASIVGTEADNDIAVLQINATSLNSVTFGNSDAIQVGDQIYPVGNPLGELAFTMTFGRVTALDRMITTSESATPINMFQIDAAVNSGNSGGPVYDDEGEVVGVVTAKYSDSGIEGLGFAIPINDAVNIATELITNGYVTGKPYLGVIPKTMSSSAAEYYNSVEGAYVTSVVTESPAALADIKAGDVIYRLGEMDVTSEEELRTALRSYRAGDTVNVYVYRSGEELTLSVTLGEQTAEPGGPYESSVSEGSAYTEGNYGDFSPFSYNEDAGW